MQVFRTDSLDNVAAFKVNTFTNEWDVISSTSGDTVYLFLPMLDSSDGARKYRLTVFEFIVDREHLDSRRGDKPIFY